MMHGQKNIKLVGDVYVKINKLTQNGVIFLRNIFTFEYDFYFIVQ